MQCLSTPSALGVPLGVIPSEFQKDLWHPQTRDPRLSCGAVCRLSYFDRTLACDVQMERHGTIANSK